MNEQEKLYKERLLKLAEFLEQMQPERFNYRYWVGLNWGGKEDLSCGTSACAFGWACTMPEFQQQGLHMYAREDGYGEFRPRFSYAPESLAECIDPTPIALAFFGEQADVCFFPASVLLKDGDVIQEASPEEENGYASEVVMRSPDHNADAKSVAAFIRKFAAYKYGP